MCRFRTRNSEKSLAKALLSCVEKSVQKQDFLASFQLLELAYACEASSARERGAF